MELDPLHTAVIDKQELINEEGELTFQSGDKISAYVVSRQGGEILLSTSMSQSNQSLDDLKMAAQSQLPVKGKVTGENKGGFDVTIMGKNCFCPVSQIDTRFVQNKSEFIGKEYEFLVEKVAEGGRNIVVSRAKLLRMAAEEKIKALEERLDEDVILDGVVTELRDYGAFVDLGGLDGFLHVSEMSYSRIHKANEFLDKGDKVRVKIINIETKDGKKRIAVSMKAATEDPWVSAAEAYPEGSSFSGKVTKLESFGAFVEITPGIEGLIHVSEMSWEKRVHHPSEVLKVGDSVKVRVVKIDLQQKRLSLSLKDINEDPWVQFSSQFSAGQLTTGTVTNLKGFGAIVELIPGVTGMLPMQILKKAFGESFRKEASPPKQLEVTIKDIQDDDRKVLLGLPNLDDDEDQDASFREYLARKDADKASTKDKAASQGTFGALLAAQLEKKNKK